MVASGEMLWYYRADFEAFYRFKPSTLDQVKLS
jgi:hypothetical protein